MLYSLPRTSAKRRLQRPVPNPGTGSNQMTHKEVACPAIGMRFSLPANQEISTHCDEMGEKLQAKTSQSQRGHYSLAHTYLPLAVPPASVPFPIAPIPVPSPSPPLPVSPVRGCATAAAAWPARPVTQFLSAPVPRATPVSGRELSIPLPVSVPLSTVPLPIRPPSSSSAPVTRVPGLAGGRVQGAGAAQPHTDTPTVHGSEGLLHRLCHRAGGRAARPRCSLPTAAPTAASIGCC